MKPPPPRTVDRLRNPYWSVVGPKAKPARAIFANDMVTGMEIGGLGTAEDLDSWQMRREGVNRWSWTVTDPHSIEFVVKHCGSKVLDPIAGTGYWGWLLEQMGVDCLNYDLHPPQSNSTKNQWHRNTDQFVLVHQGHVRDSVTMHGANRTLFLSWPPYDKPVAAEALEHYTGPRVIYIGEGEGGCTGDDKFHQMLDEDWDEVDWQQPVQFFGIHDVIRVYDRKKTPAQT